MTLTRSFVGEPLPELGISVGVPTPAASIQASRVLTLISSQIERSDIIAVEIVPVLTINGTLTFVGDPFGSLSSSSRLIGNFSFQAEDSATAFGTPMHLPVTGGLARIEQCSFFACPRSLDYHVELFGAGISLSPFDLLAADDLRLNFGAELTLECLSTNSCSTTNNATWSGSVEVRLTLRDPDPASVPEPATLPLVAAVLVALLGARGTARATPRRVRRTRI